MSSFHKLVFLGVAGATIVVSILFAESLAGHDSSELTVVPAQFATPAHRCTEQRADPRAEPDLGCPGRPAAGQP
jgi:hypothetical protein